MMNSSASTVLVVDDNPGDCRLAEMALREANRDVHVEVATTIDEAVKALERLSRNVEAILLDLGLPDTTGLDGLRRLSGCAPDIPVIVLTGRADSSTALEALNHGAGDYITKADLQPATLMRSIRYALERKKTDVQLRMANKRLTELYSSAQDFVNNVSYEFSATFLSPGPTMANGPVGCEIARNSNS